MRIWTVEDLIKELEKYPEWKDIEIGSFEGDAPIENIKEEGKKIIINPYM